MIIMKFGGATLQSAKHLTHVAQLIQQRQHRQPVVVVSAIGETTNTLEEASSRAVAGNCDIEAITAFHRSICDQLTIDVTPVNALLTALERILRGVSLVGELSPRSYDSIVSYGEQLSATILASLLHIQGMEARPCHSGDLGLITDGCHRNAKILDSSYVQLNASLAQLTAAGIIPVVTGFIGRSSDGATTTLGRNGSDLSAAILGAAVGAEEVQLWKDVAGIMTADPRRVQGALPIERLSFDEASEMAYFGAKILHPSCIVPAMQASVPVRVCCVREPHLPGTAISKESSAASRAVKAIHTKNEQVMVDITSTRMLGQAGFLGRVFSIFAELDISVDVIATSEVSISLTLDSDSHISDLRDRLGQFACVEIEPEVTIVNFIGCHQSPSNFLSEALEIFRDHDVDVLMISHGASKVNTNVIVRDSEIMRCLQQLHDGMIVNLRTAPQQN